MIAAIAPGSDSFDDLPEVEVHRPVTPKQISEKLSKKPFQIIADLMELNHFASILTELSDEIVEQLGQKYSVTFKITNAA